MTRDDYGTNTEADAARHARAHAEPVDGPDPSDGAPTDPTTEAAIDRCEWIRTNGWRDQ